MKLDPPMAEEWELNPSAALWVTDGDHRTDDGGEEIAKASLQLATGDDSFNLLDPTAAVSVNGHTLTERGSLRAYQQRRVRGHEDSDRAITADLRIVTLGQRSVTELDVGGTVVAYPPLVRLPT